MRLLSVYPAALLLILPALMAADAKKPTRPQPQPQPEGGTPAVGNSIVFLVRDLSVQDELRLKEEQRRAVRALMDEVDGPLWPLRDLPPEKGGAKVRELVAKGEAGLKGILTSSQSARIQQISLQAQGPRAVTGPDVADRLALSDPQRRKIEKITTAVHEASKKLEEMAREGERREAIEKAAQRLRKEEGDRIMAVLTEAQQEQWSTMLGAPFDLSRVKAPPFKAPELREVTTWVNAEPLTLAKLRGQVVALHFWTFGCSNCIHNYPYYKAWHEAYAKKGVTILGIHTPETQGEHDVESVKKKSQEGGLAFPIAVDNDLKNWDAWGNRIWPAVYLVDKKGYVRYWWYGELNWAGVEGEKLMRQRIEELLREGYDPGAGALPASRPAGRSTTARP